MMRGETRRSMRGGGLGGWRRGLAGGLVAGVAGAAGLVEPGAAVAGVQPQDAAASDSTIEWRVTLSPLRLYNGVDRSIDLQFDLEAVDTAADDVVDRPASLDEVRRRMLPNERRRAEDRRRERLVESERRRLEALAPPPIGLALLGMDGVPIASCDLPGPGPVDLVRVMPEVQQLRETAWLQPLRRGRPAGTALVIQPMLAPAIAVARESVSPTGARSARVTEWVDESEVWDARRAAARGEPWPPATLPVTEPAAPPVADPATDSGGEPDPAAAAGAARGRDGGSTPAETAAAPPVFTGFRIYPDDLVLLRTDLGDIVIALRPDLAPNTAWNFRSLVAGGFYRQVPFHRIVPMTASGDPFVVQAGDPSPGGSGGPGYRLPLERSPMQHDVGVVSMARDVDPDSAGSQFFICLSRAGTARLDGSYTAFGQVIEGMEVVRTIAGVPLSDVATGRPRTAPLIRAAGLVPNGPRAVGIAAATGTGEDRGPERPARDGGPPKPRRVPR